MRRLRWTVGAGAAALALLVAGCADADDDAGEDAEVEDAADPAEDAVTDTGTPPDPDTVLDPDRGEPPTELEIEDLVVGDGEEATIGSFVSVEYLGVAWSTGEEFDSSWGRDQRFEFELGDGRVIAGWEEGVEGMRVGGRRVLTIPPDLAYGERGAGPVGPNETLVFVIDLIDASPAPDLG